MWNSSRFACGRLSVDGNLKLICGPLNELVLVLVGVLIIMIVFDRGVVVNKYSFRVLFNNPGSGWEQLTRFANLAVIIYFRPSLILGPASHYLIWINANA